MVLSLFAQKDRITAQDVAAVLGLSTRMVRTLLNKWADEGWLVVADASNRGRSYLLSAIYRKLRLLVSRYMAISLLVQCPLSPDGKTVHLPFVA